MCLFDDIMKEEIYLDFLPPELILNDFIFNYPSDIEEYLTEFVNQSKFFLDISGGQHYWHVPKERQSNGENDCCSDLFSIDFKLLSTESALYAARNLSPLKIYTEGGIVSLFPRQSKGMNVAITSILFKRYDLNALLELDKTERYNHDRESLSGEREVQSILNVVKKKKNIFMLLTEFFYTVEAVTCANMLPRMEEYINTCFSSLFQFRDRFVPDMRTFLATVIQGQLCIAEWEQGVLHYKDAVPLTASPTFVKLYRFTNKPKLKLL